MQACRKKEGEGTSARTVAWWRASCSSCLRRRLRSSHMARSKGLPGSKTACDASEACETEEVREAALLEERSEACEAAP